MRSNIPLNSLRAFEATARHLSFTRAARELCVSQGAVSRHVAKLEEYMNALLFHRTTRVLTLTRTGEALYAGVKIAFDGLDSTVKQINRFEEGLNIQAALSIATTWLIPRFSDYERK